MNKHTSIVDVPGLKVGHAQDLEGMTGCTVILCPEGTVGGVDQRGGAPAPGKPICGGHLVNHVMPSSWRGSAYGWTLHPVMRYLREKGIGFPQDTGLSPSSPCDSVRLGVGRSTASRRDGYAACPMPAASPR